MNTLTLPRPLRILILIWLILFAAAVALIWNFADRATGIGATFAGLTAVLASLIAYSGAMAKVHSDERRASDDRSSEAKALHLLVERMARNLYTDSRYLIEILYDNNTKGTIKPCLQHDTPVHPKLLTDVLKRAHLLQPDVVVQITLLEHALASAIQFSSNFTNEELDDSETDIVVGEETGWRDESYYSLDAAWRRVARRAQEVVALAQPHTLHSASRTAAELDNLVDGLVDFRALPARRSLLKPEYGKS